jgi:hypothetical protein
LVPALPNSPRQRKTVPDVETHHVEVCGTRNQFQELNGVEADLNEQEITCRKLGNRNSGQSDFCAIGKLYIGVPGKL